MSKLRDPQVTVQTIHTLQEYLEVYEQSPREVRYHNTAFERETMSEDTSNGIEERTPRPKTPNVKRKRADDLERMIERSNANNVTAFEDWALENCEDDWKDLYYQADYRDNVQKAMALQLKKQEVTDWKVVYC